MKFIIKTFLTFSIVAFISSNLMSAHIIGGQMSYGLISYNSDSTEASYRIEFTLYRDAIGGGANFDPADLAFFGIYEEIAHENWVLVTEFNGIAPTPVITLDTGADDCASALAGVAIEKASYIFEITLPISDNTYMVAYQRCCRSESVINLLNPGETGAAYIVTISPSAQRLGNSSPMTIQDPIFFACANEPFTAPNSTIDAEGDSLVFNFCTPLSSGGLTDANIPTGNFGCCDCVRPQPSECGPPFDEVVFADTYSVTTPFGEGSDVKLDSITGIISGVANISGIYSYTICVEEYRDGVILSKSNREVSSMSLIQTTSTQNIEDAPISIFPNPVYDELYINIESDYSSLELLSMSGEVLDKYVLLDGNKLIVSNLSDGIYFVRMQDLNGQYFTHKFVKI